MIYRFNTTHKNQCFFFYRNRKKILKCISNHRRPHPAKTILSKKNKYGGTILPDFKICHKGTIIKIAQKQLLKADT